MDTEGSVCSPMDLEHVLNDKRAKPRYLRISLLESITNNFSDDLVIGSGGFAVVYKGLLQNDIVAVKKLAQMLDVHETRFREEVDCLMRVKHKNIVRFLGYCSDTQEKMWELDGKSVMAEERQRFLCFEYLPWSLDKYLKDSTTGREWRTCYEIIKGICVGLHYLHQEKIVHLDLKPANILLDHHMVPKIADFGISKRFDENQTHLSMTSNICGSLRYMAPECYHGQIAFKSDIYSLGIIIIEILTGNKGNPDIENVLESWSIKFETSPGHEQLESVQVCAEIGIACTDFNPAKRPSIGCILERLNEMESTFGATKSDPGTSSKQICVPDLVNEVSSMDVAAAPSMPKHISSVPHRLIETSSEASTGSAVPSPLQRITGVLHGPGGTSRKIQSDRSSEISMLLDVYPLELRFPWEPDQDVDCPFTVTNRTDCYVGVWITQASEDTNCDILCFDDVKEDSEHWEDENSGPYSTFEAIEESAPSSIFQATMEPHSTFAVPLKMKAQREPPQDAVFELMMIVIGTKEQLEALASITGIKNMDNEFLKIIEKLGGEVHRAVLKAVICDPASCQTVFHNHQFIKAESDILHLEDLHPTEPWILAQSWGNLFIINYEMQKTEMEFYLQLRGKKMKSRGFSLSRLNCFHSPAKHSISSAKFIAQEQWFVVGDSNGWVHVYSYTTELKEVIKFEAHADAHHKRYFDLQLAVHPTSPYLLTSCNSDGSIKLWDWSKGWMCTRELGCNLKWFITAYVTWYPMNRDTFITVLSRDVKVWNINSSGPIITLEAPHEASCCCLYSDGHQNFMVTDERRSSNPCVHVWDMQIKKHVHKFYLRGHPIRHVACHPTLPILVTCGEDSIVCVWDARTYRVAKMVDAGSKVRGMILTGTEDSIRLIVAYEHGISVMAVDLPTQDTADLETDGQN